MTVSANFRSSCEIKEIHKTQIKDLETRLSNSKDNEKQLNDVVVDLTKKLSDTLAKVEKVMQNQLEKFKKRKTILFSIFQEKSASATSLRNLQQVNSELAKVNDEKKTVQTKFLNEKELKHKLEKQIDNLKELSEKLNVKEVSFRFYFSPLMYFFKKIQFFRSL
jgi:DNA repair exonuclease SbcCD ATPase subunit